MNFSTFTAVNTPIMEEMGGQFHGFFERSGKTEDGQVNGSPFCWIGRISCLSQGASVEFPDFYGLKRTFLLIDGELELWPGEDEDKAVSFSTSGETFVIPNEKRASCKINSPLFKALGLMYDPSQVQVLDLGARGGNVYTIDFSENLPDKKIPKDKELIAVVMSASESIKVGNTVSKFQLEKNQAAMVSMTDVEENGDDDAMKLYFKGKGAVFAAVLVDRQFV